MNSRMVSLAPEEYANFEQILFGNSENPRKILGPHMVQQENGCKKVIRTCQPGATSAWLVDQQEKIHQPMQKIHDQGLFEAICNEEFFSEAGSEYKIRVKTENEQQMTIHDPYAFAPMLTDQDLYLFGEGNHHRIYECLGAKLREVDGVKGVNFAVWAPNAKGVSLIGSFNAWDGRKHAMQKRVPSH